MGVFNSGFKFLQRLLDVDPSAIGDGKALIYRTASGKHEYEVAGGGGGGLTEMFTAIHSNSPGLTVPTGGAPTTMVFDGESLDTGSNYNTSTGIYTAPSAGKYQFFAQLIAQVDGAEGTGGDFGAYLAITPATILSWTQILLGLPASANQQGALFLSSGPITLAQNDNVVLLCAWNGDTALPLKTAAAQQNMFTGYRLSD